MEGLNQYLNQEILNMRSEYERLFNLYNIETQVTSALKEELLTEINLKNELNSKLADALEGLDMKDEKECEAKKLKSEKGFLRKSLKISVWR